MQGLLRNKIHGFVLAIALAVALGAIGFAHRGFAAGDSLLRDAFVLAGGDLSALCGEAHAGNETAPSDCPACHVAKAFDLPPQGPGPWRAEPRLLATDTHAAVSPARARVLDPTHPLRAPPFA